MRPVICTEMTNVGNFHIHPGELVYIERQHDGTWLVSHTKSRMDIFATLYKDFAKRCEEYPTGTAPIDQVVTVSEACDILGVDRSRVHQLLERKKLVGRKSGKGWILDRQSVEVRAMYYANA